MKARTRNKCRRCGGAAELGVTSESRASVVWLCQRCAKHLGATVAPTLSAKIANNEAENALRVTTGVQREPGDALAGTGPRYRAIVVLAGLGQENEYVGEWGTDEAAATAHAEKMAADMRKIIAQRTQDVGNN